MASAEEEMNKLAYEAQYLQTQAQEMQRQLQSAIMLQSEIEATQKTIDGLKGLDDETYFQVGAGSFIRAKPSGEKGILVDIGAGVFMEKNPDDAKELLAKRSANITKAIESLKGTVEKINRRLQEIDMQAQEMQSQ